mgnify:CR=1 FL=1
MGATPYPSIPQMGLLHGAMSDEMVEFLQGNESAEKAFYEKFMFFITLEIALPANTTR